MKKLLALVLAMVMTLGLSAVSANAVDKFADADSIKYTEAATVMKAIGVFDGDDSGNFRPTETLKRSEAAKIVAYLMLTKKTADGLIPSGTRYVDVPSNHWAAGYIEYLTSEGVLGGVGNGMFNPDGDITGVDFAKMLLVALGYDAKLENLVLSDYRINTAKLANSIDLFEGNTDMVPTAAITRDEAALYAFNMIKSPMVEYDSNVRVETGNGGAVTVGNNRAYQKTSSNFTKQTISLKEAARNDKLNTNTSAQYLVEFAEEKYTDLELVGRDVTADTFGRPARKWLYKNVDLGTYIQTKDLVTTWNKKVTAKMIYDQLGKTIYDSLKDYYSVLDSWTDGMPNVIDSFTANGNSVTSTRFALSDYMDRDNTKKVNGSGNGTVTELYMDKDKNVTVVTMNVYVYQAAADYNKNSKTLRITPAGETQYTMGTKRLNSNELKLEDFPEIEDYKTDDYILVKSSWNGNSNTYEVKEIEKAEVLTGTVDSYTSDGSYSVTIDGTKHDYAVTAEAENYGDETRGTMYSVGKEAKVVVDKNGYIYAVDEALVTSDYVFITKFGSNSNLNADAVAAAYFTDGTDSTIKVKSVYDSATKSQITSKQTIASWKEGTAGGNAHGNKWYTYSKNANGEYTLYNVQKNHTQYNEGTYNGTAAGVTVMKDGQVNFGVADADGLAYNYRADDKTIIVVNDDGKGQINVYTGVKNIPGISLNNGATANVYVLNNASGVAKVVYVALKGDALVTGSANDNLLYVIKSDGSVRTNDDKNETRWQYKVLKNDGTTGEDSIVADNQIAVNGTDTRFMIANYASKNADGVYTRFYNVKDGNAKSSTVAWGLMDGSDWDNNTADVPVMNKANAPITYKNGALQVGGFGWTLADDAKITVVGVKWHGHSGQYINTDREADFEVHPWISGSELNGMFNSLSSYSYDYALRTVGSLYDKTGIGNSGRSSVKELFITVWESALATGNNNTVLTDANVITIGSNANGLDAYVTGTYIDASSANVDARYVPSQGRIYFQVKNSAYAAGERSKLCNGIAVTDGYATTSLSGSLDAVKGTVYAIDYDATNYALYGGGVTLDLNVKSVTSYSVKPALTVNGTADTTKQASTSVMDLAREQFTVTVAKPESFKADTWTLADNGSVNVELVDANALANDITGSSITLTYKLTSADVVPQVNLTATEGGWTVTLVNSAAVQAPVTSVDFVQSTYSTGTAAADKGKTTVQVNVHLNQAAAGKTITCTFAPIDGVTFTQTTVNPSEQMATVTVEVSGISENTTLNLSSVTVTDTAAPANP